jgi:DNA-binding PadR family transcriptional regulator
MRQPVFGHGRLRLYLLKLLDQGPRHGYEVISLLEDRFMGLYAPSPGTVYPRLQRLEAEGLVTHSQEGGRKVYRITEAGREELRRRQDELADLEAEIGSSVRNLATEIRDEVRGTVRDLKQELKQAAREIRREQRHENRHRERSRSWERQDAGAWVEGASQAAVEIDRRIQVFLGRTRQLVGRAYATDAQLREVVAILDEAFERIRATLRREA